jgi:hypothetical protein
MVMARAAMKHVILKLVEGILDMPNVYVSRNIKVRTFYV